MLLVGITGQLGMVQQQQKYTHSNPCFRGSQIAAGFYHSLILSWMDPSTLLAITTDNWEMVQQPTEIHPLKLLPPG